MTLLHLVSYFFGGAFLSNAVPHFVSGVTGMPFQTPFASPPGRGLSTSTLNVLWGFLNLVVFYLLVCRVGDFGLRHTADALALGFGMLVMALYAARHFGSLHGGDLRERP
ncbi:MULTISPECIES: hypothetical protein [unclassified Bradyrhizobium]|uniref:hypothetical protein n=1 Tax=unclassified Bradyrhizobium TaxID=2631580 RepID=UPI0028E90FE8|nr:MULTISPECIES: hypothetical protein [unclassified Bradyrhizobium]